MMECVHSKNPSLIKLCRERCQTLVWRSPQQEDRLPHIPGKFKNVKHVLELTGCWVSGIPGACVLELPSGSPRLTPESKI